MAKFIEVKTDTDVSLINLDNVDCITPFGRNSTSISFTGSDDSLVIKETYSSLKARIKLIECL